MTEVCAGGLGVAALDIHAKGPKHSLKCFAVGQSKITFTSSENENEKHMNESSKGNSKVRQQLIRYFTFGHIS